MITDIAAIRKRAMYDPQSLTRKEWDAIFSTVGFTTSKRGSSDDDAKVSPQQKKLEKGFGEDDK